MNATASRKPLILVVDDVATNVLLLEQILSAKYDVAVALLGEEALEVIAKRKPDLILLDVGLPDLDGFAVCRRLKADPATRAIPVIFCTALDDAKDERAGFEAGAVDYVVKPVVEPVVLARVRAQLALYDQSRRLESKVREQTAQLMRLGRLKSFFSPRLAESIVAAGGESVLRTHRREVTVARIELRGFIALTDSAEPEEVMDFLRDYHALLGREIEAHEGTLERFSGETAMVIFNDPVPDPRHAELALRMAFALRRGFAPLAEAWRARGHPLGIAVGAALGYATLGAIGFEGRWDYGVIGRVANLAARLAGAASDGQILVDPKAIAGLQRLFEARAIGPLSFDGFTTPVAASEVLAERGTLTPLATLAD